MLTNKLFYTILILLSIIAVKCQERQFRTFAGKEIDITEAPYTVFISDSCTGALVNPEWVLTAAYCFVGIDFKKANVRLGTSDKKKSQMDIKIEKVYIHPEYMNNTSNLLGAFHDIAVAKLEKPAKLSKSIKVLEIEEIEWPMESKRQCTLVGFGRNKYNNTKLHISKFQVSHGCDCIKDKDIICTKVLNDGDDSPCFGDAGSVLVCDNKGVAVTSRGLPSSYCVTSESTMDNGNTSPNSSSFGCATKDSYFLFSYLEPHLQWFFDIVPKDLNNKASRHTMKSIQCYDLITSVHLFALLIILSTYFC